MTLVALPLFHKIAGQRVVVVGHGPAADARRRLVERAGGTCCGEPEAHHARLAFVATGEARGDEAAALRLRAKGLLVNVTDRPDWCDFTVPSVLERGPVIVAVGTGGLSAGLAKQLRLRLEALLPQSLGRLADALFAGRAAVRAQWPDAVERRRVLDAALAQGGALDPMREDSADRFAGWLDQGKTAAAARTVTIKLRTNDPDDLTLREARWLGEADVVRCAAEVPAAILARARADAERLPLSPETASAAGLTVILRASP